MFDQLFKSVQAQAGANPFASSIQEAAKKIQAHVGKISAETAAYAQMEVSHVVSLSQAKKPEDALEAMVKAAQARQVYMVQKTKEAIDAVLAVANEFSKAAEAKSAEAVEQTHGALDAVFATAKQGLNIAESTAKSVVNKSSSGKKKA